MNDKLRAAHDKLQDAVAEIVSGDEWKSMLQVASKFHRYSFNNHLMIFLQRSDATVVAGFNRWKSLGRFVKKGEKGIAIFAPCKYKTKVEDEDGNEKSFQQIRGFRVVHVFDIYLYQSFLMMVQGLEAYHRRTHEVSEAELRETAELKQRVLESAPVSERKWLEGQLRDSHEPSLRRRLKVLFDEGQDLLFGIIDDRDRIIHKAVTSRNYMTHFSDHLANQAMVEDRQMHVVTEELRLLLYVCLLRDLGFSDPEIPEFLRKSQSFIRKVNAVAANRESLDV